MWRIQSTYLRVIISPRVGVSDTGRSGSSSIGLNSLSRLHINPLLRSGHLVVSGVPVAFSDGVSGVIGHTGVGQTVGGGLRNRRSSSVSSFNLSSSGMCNSWVGNSVLVVLGVNLGRLRIVVGSLVVPGKGSNLGNCTVLE
jgi:hypothetical protein